MTDKTPSGLPQPQSVAVSSDLLDRAAWMCECYAEFIRSDVMSADIERHPYLPELEGVAEDLRAALSAPAVETVAVQEAKHDHEWREHPVTKAMICRYCGVDRPASVAPERFSPVELIIRDCCEAEASDPDHPDAICIRVDHLRSIVESHAPLPVAPKAEPTDLGHFLVTFKGHGKITCEMVKEAIEGACIGRVEVRRQATPQADSAQPGAMREWIANVRDEVLTPLALQSNALGVLAEGFGQLSIALLASPPRVSVVEDTSDDSEGDAVDAELARSFPAVHTQMMRNRAKREAAPVPATGRADGKHWLDGFAGVTVATPQADSAQPVADRSAYRVFMDGDQWCAVGPGFVDLQSSPTGFGDTPAAAIDALALDTPGNRNPESRYAGYKGEPLSSNATEDQKAAWQEGKRAAMGTPQQAEQGSACEHDWTDERRENGWRSSCRRCGLKAQGSGQ